MIIRLHYAPLIESVNIKYYEFKTFYDLLKFVKKNVLSNEIIVDKVVLINIDNEILVTDNFNCDCNIEGFIFSMSYDDEIDEDVVPFINVYLQEYYSYEEAYKVALLMKEDNPMCYKKEIPFSKN